MENLRKVRNELLSLHKTLLDIEKERYESEFGKTTPNDLLQLLFNNAEFTWLRTISVLIVEIDEMFASKSGIDKDLAAALIKKAENLMDESDQFKEFKERYRVHLEIESKVSGHHETIQNLLKEKA